MWSDLAPLVTPSLGGLLALTVVLLLTGRIVPISVLNRAVMQERQRAEDFRAAAQTQGERADRLTAALSELLPYARTANTLMEELRRRVGPGP